MIKKDVARAIFDSELSRLKQEGYDKVSDNDKTDRKLRGPDGNAYEVSIDVSPTESEGWFKVQVLIGGFVKRAYQVIVSPNGEWVVLK